MKLSYNDSQHAYWLDGKRTKSVTTIAKIPDNTYTLEQWGKRMVAIGMARDGSLVERAAAHHDDRDKMEQIVNDAMRAAKTSEKADHGTAIHRIAERVDLGEELIETELSKKIAAAWPKAIDLAGFTILPEYVERIVVYPDLPLCGRWDRLVRNKRTGKLAVLDLKSGINAIKYPHSTAIQLAIYANAPLIAANLEWSGKSESTETFEKVPANVDKKWAVVAYVQPDGEKIELYKIDIAAGWKAAKQICFPTLEWRDNKMLVSPLASVDVNEPAAHVSGERFDWMRGRINAVGLAGEEARKMLATLWPSGVSPKGPWTEADVNVLDEIVGSVEKQRSVGFPTRDPALTSLTP